MSPLSFLLNVVWLICGGALMALGWVVAGLVMALTIVGLPWTRAAFSIARYSLLPFGHRVVERARWTGHEDLGTGTLGTLGNLIWLVLAGWWLALGHLGAALLFALTHHRPAVRLGASEARGPRAVADRPHGGAGRCRVGLRALEMTMRDPTALARAALAAFASGDTADAEDFIAPDYANLESEDRSGARGPAEFRDTVAWIHRSFAELRYEEVALLADAGAGDRLGRSARHACAPVSRACRRRAPVRGRAGASLPLRRRAPHRPSRRARRSAPAHAARRAHRSARRRPAQGASAPGRLTRLSAQRARIRRVVQMDGEAAVERRRAGRRARHHDRRRRARGAGATCGAGRTAGMRDHARSCTRYQPVLVSASIPTIEPAHFQLPVTNRLMTKESTVAKRRQLSVLAMERRHDRVASRRANGMTISMTMYPPRES